MPTSDFIENSFYKVWAIPPSGYVAGSQPISLPVKLLCIGCSFPPLATLNGTKGFQIFLETLFRDFEKILHVLSSLKDQLKG